MGGIPSLSVRVYGRCHPLSVSIGSSFTYTHDVITYRLISYIAQTVLAMLALNLDHR